MRDVGKCSFTVSVRVMMRGFFILFLALTTVLSIDSSVDAQIRWRPSQVIPNYNNIYPPHLVSDPRGLVHAIYTEDIDEQGGDAIFYRQWSPESGWTAPNDVILSESRGRIDVGSVFLDRQGVLHLVYVASTAGDIGSLVYRQAPVDVANDARAWTEARVLDERAGPLFFARISGSANGHVIIMYTGQQRGPGIYDVRSNDGGVTWHEPSAVSLLFDEERILSHFNFVVDEQAQLHAVWTVADVTSGIGESVWYASSSIDVAAWGNPTALAQREGEEYGTDWPSIIAHRDELFVLYMDGGPPPTRYVRRSLDGGETWTPAQQPWSQVGEYGYVVLLEDSANNLHAVVANRLQGSGQNGGTWHAMWLEDQWSELSLITPRSEAEAQATGSYSYRFSRNASRPEAVVVQGNVLLATWWHDMPDQPTAAFSYGLLDAPALAVEPIAIAITPDIATEEPQGEPEPTPSLEPTPTRELAPLPVADDTPVRPSGSNTGQILFVGVLLPLLFVTLVVVIVRARTSYNARTR